MMELDLEPEPELEVELPELEFTELEGAVRPELEGRPAEGRPLFPSLWSAISCVANPIAKAVLSTTAKYFFIRIYPFGDSKYKTSSQE